MLVAVSHINVEGHIILIIGYENYIPNASSADFKLVVHDPYGQFDRFVEIEAFRQETLVGRSFALKRR